MARSTSSSLTGVGDLGAAILQAIPAEFQAAVQPFIGAIVEGIHGAFSLATAADVLAGRVRLVSRLIAAVAIKEIPLRTTNEAPVPAAAAAGGRPLEQARAGLRQHGDRRLTFAPPRTQRPRWTPPGPSFVPRR